MREFLLTCSRALFLYDIIDPKQNKQRQALAKKDALLYIEWRCTPASIF